MKIFSLTAKILFIIAVPIFLFSLTIGIAFNSLWFYNHGFTKYNISQATGLAPAELDMAARGLINYFDNNQEYINITVTKNGQPMQLFNERETIHLKDVKSLLWLDYKVFLTAVLLIAAYVGVLLWRRSYKNLAFGLAAGGGLTLLLMLVLGVAIITGFDSLFWEFHILSFSNDFWLLDPATDYMIMMFPQEFWFDAFAFVAGLTAGLAVVTGGVGSWWSRRIKAKSAILIQK